MSMFVNNYVLHVSVKTYMISWKNAVPLFRRLQLDGFIQRI